MANSDKITHLGVLGLSGDSVKVGATTTVYVDRVDTDGYVTECHGESVPSAEAGYAVGCIMRDTNATGAANIFLVNEGSTSSCSFVSTAPAASTITVADESTDTSCFPCFFASATGALAPKTDASNLTYNSNTGALGAASFVGSAASLTANTLPPNTLPAVPTDMGAANITIDLSNSNSTGGAKVTHVITDGNITSGSGFVGDITGNVTGNASGSSGSCTGNAATATALATPRAIGGVNFDGTSSIVPTTIVVADSADTTCWVGLFEEQTGNLLPKTDAGLSYNASTGALSATTVTAGTLTAANEATDTTCFPLFATAATGSAPKTNAGLTFNSNTGEFGATSILVPSTGKASFNATTEYVNSSGAGQLDIDAATEVEITAPTVQIVTSTLMNLDATGGFDLDVGPDGTIAMDVATQDTAATAGGNATLTAGTGNTTGAGGNIVITAGAGGNDGVGGDLQTVAGAAGGGNRQGGTASIYGGAGKGTQAGGTAIVSGGAAQANNSGNGGAAYVYGGDAGTGTGSGTGGLVTILGGAGGVAGGNAGGVTISGGTPTVGNGGTIAITGSDAVDAGVGARNGGDVDITAGAKIGAGTAGAINLKSDIYVTSGKKLSLRTKGDQTEVVWASADGQMDLDATTEIEMSTGILDIDLSKENDYAMDILVAQGTSAAGGHLRMVAGQGFTASAGGNVVITSGAGVTTGAGGTMSVTAGAGGNDAVGGQAEFKAGAAGGGDRAGGEAKLTAGAGSGTQAGGAATITAGAAGATGTGGQVNITSGASTAGATGQVIIKSGNATAGDSGAITIQSGTPGDAGAGGQINITGAAGVSTGVAKAGGTVAITAGAGSASGDSDGGDITLLAGAGSNAGTGGDITLTSGACAGGTAGAINLASDVYLTSGKKLSLRTKGDQTEYISSTGDGTVDIVAGTKVDVTATDTNFSGDVNITDDLEVTGRIVQSTVTAFDISAANEDIDCSVGNIFLLTSSDGAKSVGSGGAENCSLTNGVTGQTIILVSNDGVDTITLTEAGNVHSAGDFAMAQYDSITLLCTDGTNWVELNRSNN